MKQKIKVGLLLNSYEIETWAYIAIKRVFQSANTDIDLVIINDHQKTASKPAQPPKIVYRLFDSVDKLLNKNYFGYKKPKSIQRLLTAIKTINIDCAINQLDLQQINDNKLDILINLNSGVLTGDILDVAKYGVWSYQFGDINFNRGELVGFWEAMTCQPAIGVNIKRLESKHLPEQILYQSSVVSEEFKPSPNKSQLHYLAAGFLSRQIDLLYNLGEKLFFLQVNKYNNEINYLSYPDFKQPDNFEAMLLFGKYLFNTGIRIIRRLFYYEHWYLFYNLNPKTSDVLNQYQKLMPAKDRFWADPFVIYTQEKYYIFFEELMYGTNRAHLSVIEMDTDGKCSEATIILKKDYHLSYPFIFEYENKFYMIPESIENKTIELYECTDFPMQWKFKMNLMEDICAVDSTLFFKDNKWWLFTAMEDVKGSSTGNELFLFWADTPFTQHWTSHPLNPVVSSVKTARPAGKIYIKNNKIYRPSQDCSLRYGHYTNINEITELTETTYSEKLVNRITPNWDKEVIGTHTLNADKNMTIVDAYYSRRKYFNK
ncbi:MAG: hypothetical protein QM479_13670 [Pseudomonadota bacterium]